VNEPWLIYGLIFGAAVLGVEALYWLVFRTRGMQKSVNRRLLLSRRLTSRTEVLDALRLERGFAEFKSPALAGLNDLLVQTGLRVARSVLLLSVFALGMVIFAISSLAFGVGLISLCIATALAPALAVLVLRIIRAKRIARFAEQLPDAIDVIVRGVRAGHPFSTAIDLVARELPDPVGTEFGMTADEITFGLGISTAIGNLYRRVGQDDLLYLVIAINVQSQSGGNLAEILSRLSQLVRQRSKLRLKIKALSAEGRMSAYFLSAMPFIIFAVVSLISPGYFSEIRGHVILVPALIYGVLSLTIGNVMLYRMVHFKF
jgi:tight adherence protein B